MKTREKSGIGDVCFSAALGSYAAAITNIAQLRRRSTLKLVCIAIAREVTYNGWKEDLRELINLFDANGPIIGYWMM